MDVEEAWGQLVSLTDVDSEPIPLSKDRLTIGRAPDCDIPFAGNKLVSGHHCCIERDVDGQVWLKDSSTNGTLLNLKCKVTKGNRKELNHGDEFYIVYKKDNTELNIGYIYQNMAELEKEQSLEETQEYSTDDVLEATLADDDINEVESTDDSPKSRKRTKEPPSPMEPAKKLKCEKTEKSEKCEEKTDIDKSVESENKTKNETSVADQEKCSKTAQSKSVRDSEAEAEKKDEIEEALVCIICQEIMHDCVSLQPCMHTFCAGCYSGWMKRSSECPSCRLKVDRINKNHIVNNLIEAYLKEHPEKKRSEEDIKELEAKNTISRDMLYPKELKNKVFDADESGEDSDDYEEDSDEVDDDPPTPVTLNPINVGQGFALGSFRHWNPVRFVCRQCPNYVDPNTPATGTGVLGTVLNTVKNIFGGNQAVPTTQANQAVPMTEANQAGPSGGAQSTANQTGTLSDDSQGTLPTTSTEAEVDDFEERKKRDDMKQDVTPQPYVCVPNQNHILCQCCLQPMPDRRIIADTRQQCSFCLRSFCHAYWGCRKAECMGCIGRFKDIIFGRKCLQNLILENPFESDILKNYLEEKKITLNEMKDVCMEKLDTGYYKCADQGRLMVTSNTTTCYACALRNFKDLAYCYRADIKKEDLPEAVTKRNDCYWGKNCRTQKNRPHHAQNFNHICQQTRTA
ncbi:E3 ubiquitin-protein ligase CHFR-like [Saccostrea cucullata]|uniref:E3 ubiquitin-protein ligase CHFR-like n=1 Tax=Saccostrea cuccullata TaxID=36930 RepID=UPI002ED62303